MTAEDIIKAIHEHALVVRCLPYETFSTFAYSEGDESRYRVNSKGENISSEYSVEINAYGNKVLVRRKKVEKGGWWYVKQAYNTDSTVIFSAKMDIIKPTLEEAVVAWIEKHNRG